MTALVKIATILPWEYYKSLDTHRDMSVYSFLETCYEQAPKLVASKIYLLEAQVSREEFDKVFDAHWHNGFMIRHLIYKLSRGDTTVAPMNGSPASKKRSLISTGTAEKVSKAPPKTMGKTQSISGGSVGRGSVGRGSVSRGSLV